MSALYASLLCLNSLLGANFRDLRRALSASARLLEDADWSPSPLNTLKAGGRDMRKIDSIYNDDALHHVP